MQPLYVIITAGGSGVRMNSPLPKQFLELRGKPILLHSISVFLRYAPQINVILVLPQGQQEFWQELCRKHNFFPSIDVVDGGPTRFHSVKNGLKKVPDNALVAIHDGVRPLVSLQTIQQAFHIAQRFGNAIPAIGINESVRQVEGAFSKIISRDQMRIIQTPQCFQAAKIKDAYNVNYMETFTDDASVLERIGERIYLTEGNRENIKITSPQDLFLADALMNYLEAVQA